MSDFQALEIFHRRVELGNAEWSGFSFMFCDDTVCRAASGMEVYDNFREYMG